MPIKTVLLIGASGTLGPAVFSALLASPFVLTVGKRASSKATFPSGTNVVDLPDDIGASSNRELLRKCLTGQDAVVCTIPGSRAEDQVVLADVAIEAGVQRFVPADFGSVCSTDATALRYAPLYGNKGKVRAHLNNLAHGHPSFSWTALVGGHFFDYGLKSGLLGIDVQGAHARLFDGGDIRWSASTLGLIGRATVAVLQNESDVVRNQLVYIQSFCTSQNEVIGMLERITGRTFKSENISAQEYLDAEKAKMDRGDKEATENVVGVLGLTRSNFESGEHRAANNVIGLQQEDLEEVIRQTVKSAAA